MIRLVRVVVLNPRKEGLNLTNVILDGGFSLKNVSMHNWFGLYGDAGGNLV